MSPSRLSCLGLLAGREAAAIGATGIDVLASRLTTALPALDGAADLVTLATTFGASSSLSASRRAKKLD